MTAKQNKKNIIAILYMTVLTFIAFVYGLSIIPSPALEQIRSVDHKRVVDLGELQTAIDKYYQDNGILPRQLSELTSNTYDSTSPLDKIDPQTKQPYEYSQIDAITYKLCATFTTSSLQEDQSEVDYDVSNPDYSNFSGQFKHPAGHFCFEKNESKNSVIPQPLIVPSRKTSTASPSAVLNSFNKSGTCEWTPTFSLKGFAPYSAIHVNAHLNLSDCTTGKAHPYEMTAQWSQETDSNGSLLLNYSQEGYGNSLYTFTDSQGNAASIRFTYEQTSPNPTIIPLGNNSSNGTGL